MKAWVLHCVVSDSAIDRLHGANYRINRLVISGENELTITPHRGHIYVWANKDWPKGNIIAEIDVSDELVAAANGLLEAKNGLKSELLGDNSELAQHFIRQFGSHEE